MKTETNKFIRAWIWFWYNDITRVCILLGLHLILTIPLLILVGVSGESLKTIVMAQYVFMIVWAVADNDYSNLNRIGLSVNRKPLKEINTVDHGESIR